MTLEMTMPPARFPRRRLAADLDRWVPLTVVRGPSGYGKSTLVRQWADEAASAGVRVLWCRPGSSEDLCAAVLAALGEDVAPLAVPGSRPDPLAARRRAQELIAGYEGRTVLVVDGLDDRLRGDLIGQLIELSRLRPDFRLIVTTRVRDAAEDLATLTLGVHTISPHDLLLCRAEIADLAAARGVALTGAQAELVRQEVGGWPILVDAVLARLARSRRIDAAAITGAATGAHEGLWSHVLRKSLSQPEVDLLAELSVAECLTVEAARFLSGDVTVERLLGRLEAAGAVASELGPDGALAFNIPPSVGCLARAHATSAVDQSARSAALARHLVVVGQPERAVRQAFASRDWALVGEIFEHAWLDLWSSEDPTVRRALVEVPADMLRGRPSTLAAKVIVTGSLLSPADLQIPVTRSPAELRQIAHVIGLSAALQTSALEAIALRRSGRFSDALAIAKTVADVSGIAGEGVPASMLPVVPWGRYELALTALLAGDTALASEQLQATIRSTQWASSKAEHIGEMAQGLFALKTALRGDLLATDVRTTRARTPEGMAPDYLLLRHDRGAAATIAEAIAAVDRLDRASATRALNALRDGEQGHELWGFAAWAEARFSLHWGDRRGGIRSLCDARRFHRPATDDGGMVHSLLVAAEADLLLADRRANRAAILLAKAPAHPVVGVARARFALAIGDFETAVFESLAVLVDDDRLDRLRLDALLVHALGITRMRGVEPALPWWKEALATASRLGSPLAPFALLSPELVAPVEPHLPELRAMTRRAREHGRGLPESVEVIVLSPRQQSVLEALARGMPIPAIARSQFVSQNTIKTQLRSLYSKLGAHSREEAVILARDAGLIED